LLDPVNTIFPESDPAAAPLDFAAVREAEQKWLAARFRVGDFSLLPPAIGLSLSGGGVRSATFSVGAIQGLAKKKLLSRLSFLSSVSGGGYASAWLVAWTSRESGGIHEVEALLGGTREPLSLRHLRSFSNYLTPNIDLLGSDKWTFAATILVNLGINILVLWTCLEFVMFTPLLAFAVVTSLTPDLTITTWLSALAVFLLCTIIECAYLFVDAPRPWQAVSRSFAHYLGLTSFYLSAMFSVPAVASLRSDFIGKFSRAALAEYAQTWSESYLKYLLLTIVAGLAYGAYSDGLLRAFGWLRRKCEPLRTPSAIIASGTVAFVALSLAVPWATTYIYTKVNIAQITPRISAFVFAPIAGLLYYIIIAASIVTMLGRRVANAMREWTYWMVGRWFFATTVGVLLAALALISPYYSDQFSPTLMISFAGFSGVLSALLFGHFSLRTKKTLARVLRYISIGWSLIVIAAVARLNVNLIAPGIWDSSGSRFWEALEAALNRNMFAYWIWALLAFILTSAKVGNNRFSMNLFYRNRIIQSYVSASSPEDRRGQVRFCDENDLALAKMAKSDYVGPLPIYNASLNVMAARDLSRQQRRACSFVFTPLFSGFSLNYETSPDSSRKAYVGTEGYEGGISLAHATAISGAALNPQMGEFSSRPVGFLLALLNLRLGWWLRNPLRPENATRVIRNRALTLASELLGLTHETADYVYVSDGGHFETLGLYELVQRDCPVIIAIDATEDSRMEYEALGNAVRKCRVDFNVDIRFESELQNRPLITPERPWDLARVSYAAAGRGEDGVLLYVKACHLSSLPIDVSGYARQCKQFPHESTGNQWFNEAQFESYRALGEITVETVFNQVEKEPRTPLAEKLVAILNGPLKEKVEYGRYVREAGVDSNVPID
jgi:hypothetical protein